VFALDYTLVPDACYPTQIQQAFAGYDYVLSIIDDPRRICVSGDSAGAALVLSMLLYMGNHSEYQNRRPELAVLVSPWTTLISAKNKNTACDYLDVNRLHLYARQYAAEKVPLDDPMVSPGNCKDLDMWTRASPPSGWYVVFGSEEVFAPETRDFVTLLRKVPVDVESVEEPGDIHAWPVASLFLETSRKERLRGIRGVVDAVKYHIDMGPERSEIQPQ
jgi:acetyl esterase/lipase